MTGIERKKEGRAANDRGTPSQQCRVGGRELGNSLQASEEEEPGEATTPARGAWSPQGGQTAQVQT